VIWHVQVAVDRKIFDPCYFTVENRDSRISWTGILTRLENGHPRSLGSIFSSDKKLFSSPKRLHVLRVAPSLGLNTKKDPSPNIKLSGRETTYSSQFCTQMKKVWKFCRISRVSSCYCKGDNFFSIKEEGNESVIGGKNRRRKEKGKWRKGQYWENKCDTENMNERQA